MTIKIIIFSLIALLAIVVIAFINYLVKDSKDEPDYYTPSDALKKAKIEIDDNRDEIDRLDKEIENAKNEKNNTADDIVNQFKNIKR